MSTTLRQFIASQSTSPPGTTIRECLNNPITEGGSGVEFIYPLNGTLEILTEYEGVLEEEETLQGTLEILTEYEGVLEQEDNIVGTLEQEIIIQGELD